MKHLWIKNNHPNIPVTVGISSVGRAETSQTGARKKRTERPKQNTKKPFFLNHIKNAQTYQFTSVENVNCYATPEVSEGPVSPYIPQCPPVISSTPHIPTAREISSSGCSNSDCSCNPQFSTRRTNVNSTDTIATCPIQTCSRPFSSLRSAVEHLRADHASHQWFPGCIETNNLGICFID